MKKRKYREVNKIHVDSCYRFNPRKIHPELNEFMVGENESHPLASLMELVSVLIENYEDAYVPGL